MAFIGNTLTQQAFTPAVDVFSGNGSTTAFTLSRPVASVAQVEAVIENVQQSPVDAYTVNGNTITFTSAPPSGSSNIYVLYTSPITQVIAPTDGSVGTSKLVDAAVTQSKLAANVAGTGAAFSAYITTAQTVTTGVVTLAQFGSEVFDTNSRFNNTSSTVGGIPAYAFMPDVAGYYQINWSVYVVIVGGTGANLRSYLYKNGSIFMNGSFTYNVTLSDLVSTGSNLVYFNGTTDYVQVFGGALFVNSGTPKLGSSQTDSTFSAAFVRAS